MTAPNVTMIPIDDPTLTAKHAIACHCWEGNGPDVVLLHGTGSNADSWLPVVKQLRGAFTPIAIDHRGHGMSAKPERGYAPEDYASDLDAVLAARGIERPLLVGHSLGGLIALAWAKHHPHRARAIVIEDSPLRTGRQFEELFDVLIAQNAMSIEELVPLLRERRPDLTAEQARARAEVTVTTAPGVLREMRDDALARDGEDTIGLWTGITSPILMVHADPARGGMVDPGDLRAFESRLANVTSTLVPDAGHTIHRDQPEAFLEAVIPFLLDHAGPQGGTITVARAVRS